MAAPKKRVLNDTTDVTVISNFGGLLFYRSPQTQEDWEFAEYGDEHELTVRELKTMKAQHRTFFEQQWIIFAEKDYDVIPHLKLEKYYKNIVSPEQLEQVLDGSSSEIKAFLQDAADNVKDLVFMKAKEKYENKELTDVHVIEAIETSLGVEIDPTRLK